MRWMRFNLENFVHISGSNQIEIIARAMSRFHDSFNAK
jgi:hypothetical protein